MKVEKLYTKPKTKSITLENLTLLKKKPNMKEMSCRRLAEISHLNMINHIMRSN